ncbi:MAG: cell division protein FtsA, partial [Pseudomonadota bacterium]|nr:cell division protein FtsA [Pseudomonadota bacterium]
MGRSGKTRTGLIAALDVGSSKICCLIAQAHNDGAIRISGVGHHASLGIKSGAIVDMAAAQNSILTAVSAAEEMAGERIREVILSVAGSNLSSQNYSATCFVSGKEISENEIRRLLGRAGEIEQPLDRELLHCLPVGYSVDGTKGVRDPRGMFAEELTANMHLVTAKAAGLRNLASCIERCHLDIECAVAAPYASGLACLVEDEIDLGATIIDMGGGTTSIAVFYDGALIFTDSIALGGQHVTNDIARGLSTPITQAERMKTLYGSAVISSSDELEVLDVPLIGEQNPARPNHVPRSLLNGVIRPRLEETFEMIRARLDTAGLTKTAGRRLVLTGGASLLAGAAELAGLVMEKRVRIGRP